MITIESTVNDDICVIKLIGRLDVKAAAEADVAFAEAAQAATHITLDLSELEYIASSGLRALKRLYSAVHANNGTLTLKDVQDDVMEVLEMTGFSSLLTFAS